jgi:transcriptional regulator with XRE-family HTH domain
MLLYITMNYKITHIANKLKAERETRGLSQRALSKLAGVPQSHISKIESGTVDLRLSSLIELARVLGLELILVPRKTLPAVKSIVQGSVHLSRKIPNNDLSTIKELKCIQNEISGLTREHPLVKEFAQIQRQARDIQRFRIPKSELDTLLAANKALQAYEFDPNNFGPIRKILSEFQNVRNALAHSSIKLPELESTRSAYSLDGDDNG